MVKDNLEGLGPKRGPFRWLLNTGPGNFTLAMIVFMTLILVPVFNRVTNDGWSLAAIVPINMGIGALLLWFTLNYGKPANWWIPFGGTEMIAPVSEIMHKRAAGKALWGHEQLELEEEIIKEIQEWLATSCPKGVHQINRSKFLFRRKRDAAMFKLTWM